jgi:hypothetical protein
MGSLTPRRKVLQCYTAWPAGTKLRFKVLQSATQGATFLKSLRVQGTKSLKLSANFANFANGRTFHWLPI